MEFRKKTPEKITKENFEPDWVRYSLTAIALLLLFVLFLLPVLLVFQQAFGNGIKEYAMAILDMYSLSAIGLTLIATITAVILNTIFGIAAAWLIAKFEFNGKSLLVSLIDIPFMVSPVVSGLIFVLVYGAHGWLGPFLQSQDINIIFAVPGIILATTFVTLPFVARELIPVMESIGNDSEEASLSLGAGPWTTFFKITLPNIKWGLMYGIVLCTARAMGEFGAVSVVSGHIRGLTTTIPLHVEMLYNEYSFTAAFAVASILMIIALLTVVVKKWISSNDLHSRRKINH